MSLKLTTSLSQRLVLTPQLRQRIEMLQMTTLELSDLIQQQLLENPVLEEVPSQEEVQELAEKVLDHLASSDSEASFGEAPEPGSPPTNGSGDAEARPKNPTLGHYIGAVRHAKCFTHIVIGDQNTNATIS